MARHLARTGFSFTRILRLHDVKTRDSNRYLITSSILRTETADDRRRDKMFQLVTLNSHFNREQKDKQTFMELLDAFDKKKKKTGIAEFISIALRRMRDYGVQDDLEVYKKLLNLFPKGQMVATNWFLVDTMYFPKQQRCTLELLVYMEDNRVMPDREMYDILFETFGPRSMPMYKYFRMVYWLPKFKNLGPWPAPNPRPADDKEAAKLAIKRITSVDLESELSVFSTTEDDLSHEDTWIVSGQSPIQKKLIHYHPPNVPMYVEGAFNLYLGRKDVSQYYILRSELPKNRRRREFRDPDVIKNLKIPFFDPPTPDDMIPDFSVHEQRDGIIFAVGTTGTKTKSSLMSWIRLLQKNGNPRLANIPILFRDNASTGQNDEGNELLSSGLEAEKTENTN